MKEKIEAKLKERKVQRDGLLIELQKIEKAQVSCRGQIVACNGAIEQLEELLKDTGGE